jgi:hypothetical protein
VPRLRRFLHLERPRADREGDRDGSAATASRVEGIRGGGARPAAPTSSGARLDRFAQEPALELAERPRGPPPCTRCMRCEMDNGAFAVECAGCGARLDTDEQRAFAASPRASPGGDGVQEARPLGQGQGGDEGAIELAAARRAMGEELARAVGTLERRRLAGGPAGWATARGALLRLLGRLFHRGRG